MYLIGLRRRSLIDLQTLVHSRMIIRCVGGLGVQLLNLLVLLFQIISASMFFGLRQFLNLVTVSPVVELTLLEAIVALWLL